MHHADLILESQQANANSSVNALTWQTQQTTGTVVHYDPSPITVASVSPPPPPLADI